MFGAQNTICVRETMNRIAKLILFLMIVSLSLLSACGESPSTTPPNGDHLVKFGKNGVAVLRGHYWSGTIDASANETMNIVTPVKVEGIEAGLSVPFIVRDDTKILSSQMTSPTTVREYHIFHPSSSLDNAFPRGALLEVSFVKGDTQFEIASIQDVTQKPSLFQKSPSIDHLFSIDISSKSALNGSFTQALNKTDGTVIWTTSIPIPVQGVQAAVILQIHSAPNTQVITSKGIVSADSGFSWGDGVQIQFTRKGDQLIADQVTVIP
jgi:hypothetical protein